jgi:hypothetical protein
VHGRVQAEAGLVDGGGECADDVAGAVDLDEVRRRHLVEAHAECVDQVVARLARHGGGDVGVDAVGPAVQRA